MKSGLAVPRTSSSYRRMRQIIPWLFSASDPHGSVQLWKKFLRAGEFYGASVLVLGGDLAGKAFVPIVRRQEDGQWQALLFGRDHVVSHGEVDELEASIRLNGMYPY